MTKTKGAFPTPKSIRKLLYLANERITKKWTIPIPNWALILNQLVIRFGLAGALQRKHTVLSVAPLQNSLKQVPEKWLFDRPAIRGNRMFLGKCAR